MKGGAGVVVLVVALVLCLGGVAHAQQGFTQPFSRVLSVQDPLLTGDDVTVLQNLLQRSSDVSSFPVSGSYDQTTADQVAIFQKAHQLPSTGEVDAATSNLVLQLYSYDGYKDDGTIPDGYLYKVFVPVFRDRMIETQATVFAANGSVLHQFRVHTHGQNDSVTGAALNQFAGDGSTPTGLSTFDLNSPEPDPVSYGPYPINRFVKGIKGNAAFLISNIRNGILLHTGEWANWNPNMEMPDSHGCIHAHPDDIRAIWNILVALGVQVRPNPFGKLPYPYVPQGVVSVQQMD